MLRFYNNEIMKQIKIVVLILLVVFSATMVAQEKKVEFSIGAGYLGHTSKMKQQGDKSLDGFHVGGLLTYNINDRFGVQTGLLYSSASGVRVPQDQVHIKKLGTWHQTKTEFDALDIPLRVIYSYMLAEEFYIQLFLGPNFNWGLNRKENTEYFTNDKKYKTNIGKNIYKTDNYSQLDMQIGGGIGLQWKGIGLSFTYDWGLLNRTSLPNMTYKANDLKLTISYKF